MEIGIASFGDIGPDITPQQRIAQLLEEIRLADEVGLDVFGVGEHHRADYVVSSPTTVLAAAAAQTRRIRLSSAVTVLSSADPVRVFEDFSTVDLISGGRAEIMAGRGSFIESFPLFGYDLDDYDDLYAEHLDLLLKIRASERVTWSGKHRAPLQDALIVPRPVQDPLPVWVAVGGSPQSVVRAGALGLPLTLAIIGGQPARFAPLIDLYRRAIEETGNDPALPVAVNLHGFVGDTRDAAADAFAPGWLDAMSRIGRERGWPPASRAQFDQATGPDGHLVLGDASQVTEKLIALHETFGHQRTMLQLSVGATPHRELLRAIELLGTEVAPKVRAAVGEPAAAGGTLAG